MSGRKSMERYERYLDHDAQSNVRKDAKSGRYEDDLSRDEQDDVRVDKVDNQLIE
jgi:hypothetical protein